MDMNFPHPRRALAAVEQPADYSALVASATSRQATSRTVSALLSAPRGYAEEINALDSRIAFFAFGSGHRRNAVRGAFWPTKFESAVNLEDSNNVKFDQLPTIKPELQAVARGTEL
jgi:hypothetical protein